MMFLRRPAAYLWVILQSLSHAVGHSLSPVMSCYSCKVDQIMIRAGDGEVGGRAMHESGVLLIKLPSLQSTVTVAPVPIISYFLSFSMH